MRRVLLIPAILFSIFLLAGCGATTSLTPPVVRTAQITTAPIPLPRAGGTATLQVEIQYPPTDPNAMLPFLSPTLDVKDASGLSLFTQPRTLNTGSQPNTYTTTFTVPGNVGGLVPKVYTLTVVPNGPGGGWNTPTDVGTLTVPN